MVPSVLALVLAAGAAASPLARHIDTDADAHPQPYARRAPPRPCTTPLPLTNYGPDLTYAITLSLGTPAQNLTFVVDTGSPDVWVLSSAVAGLSTGPGFDGAASSSFVGSSEEFHNVYGSGEVRGAWASDVVCLGSKCVRQAFGVIDAPGPGVTFEGTPVAGVLGLDWGLPGREQVHAPLWRQLSQAWGDKQFGLRLSRGPTDYFGEPFARAGAVGSSLTLGGLNRAQYAGTLHYIPLAGTTDFWRVALGGVRVAGRPVDTGALFAALDSGSSIISGHPASVAALYAAVPGAWLSPGGRYFVPCDGVAGGSAPRLGVGFVLGGREYALADADAVLGAFGAAAFNGTAPGGTQLWCMGSIQPFYAWPDYLPPAFVLGIPFLKSWYSAYRLAPPAIGLARAV
ncbi:hypothetical protein Q8F55_003423 [Vanrija albida]|uniref:Peptidase A1 domain-containing protein n=1 Tax=Vanrija albida TaxID=181172 RepID=A0ABR3Q3V7_9TREE